MKGGLNGIKVSTKLKIRSMDPPRVGGIISKLKRVLFAFSKNSITFIAFNLPCLLTELKMGFLLIQILMLYPSHVLNELFYHD